jgi:hypothetical protein
MNELHQYVLRISNCDLIISEKELCEELMTQIY